MNRQGKNWNEEEICYLREKYGTSSVSTIAKTLGRTEYAVINKINRLGLGSFLENSEYVSFNALIKIFKASHQSWENNGIPIIKKKRVDKNVKMVKIEDFWEWAEYHRNICNFKNLEKNLLGKEPEWVDEARRSETYSPSKSRAWNEMEISLLKQLCNSGNYNIIDISKNLNRSDGAIKRKIYDLYLPTPPRLPNHEKYTEYQNLIIKNMIKSGYGYKKISEEIGKSEKGIRGYIYRNYGTEKLDKIRRIINEK